MSQAPQYSTVEAGEVAAFVSQQASSDALPRSVRVIGITGAVLGGLAMIHNGLGLLIYFASNTHSSPFGPVFAQYSTISDYVFGFFAGLCFIASIGCLARIEWARKLLVGYAMGYAVCVVFSVAMMFLYVIPDIVQPVLGNGPMAGAQTVGLYIGAIVPNALCLILPLFILIFLQRPEVKAAFAPAVQS